MLSDAGQLIEGCTSIDVEDFSDSESFTFGDFRAIVQ